MYLFAADERVQHRGQVTSLASVWSLADEQKTPYVYMLDGCGLGDGIAYPITKERLIAELVAEFEVARSTGMGPFVQVFENVDGRWTQFAAREMKQKLENQVCPV